MTGRSLPDLSALAGRFKTLSQPRSFSPITSGHINETLACVCEDGRRYVLQRINTDIFPSPEDLMQNFRRVTDHLRSKGIVTLSVVEARTGDLFVLDASGGAWRMLDFLEGGITYDVPQGDHHVLSAARAFGQFQRGLSDLPAPRLHEIIPDFHNTRKRYDAFLSMLRQDPENRAAGVKKEIDYCLAREKESSVFVDLLKRGDIPERVVHNDTKITNVMMDAKSGEALCVIDLDTVMPGFSAMDFGDAVRMGASTAPEDAPDPSKMSLDLNLYENIAQGFLEGAGPMLNKVEVRHLAFGAKLITLEQAIRFLGDYLMGDRYYRIHRPGQNLDRTRAQLALVVDMERKFEEMEKIVRKYSQ